MFVDSNRKLSISSHSLLWIYSFVLVFLFLAIFDSILFNFSIKNFVDQFSVETALIIFILTEFLHILMGFNSFFSLSYIKFYKKELFLTLLVLIFLSILLFFGNFMVFSLVLIFFSNYHFAMQHLGITKMLIQNSSIYFEIVKWMSIFLIEITFINSFFSEFLGPFQIPEFLIQIVFFLLFVFYILTLKTSKTKEGKYFLIANMILYFSFAYFLHYGYVVFFLLTQRIVHDITAIFFYVVHDNNYSLKNKDNFIFNILRKLKLNFPFLIVIYSLGICLLIYLVLKDIFPLFYLYGFSLIAMIHYVLENFNWKGGTPHRKYVKVKI